MRTHTARSCAVLARVPAHGIAIAACALLAVVLQSSPTRAGTITLTYGIGPAIAVEPHTGAWTGVGGILTVSVSAFRSTPGSTMGFISGGTVLYLALAGGPTHAPPYGGTYWTIAGPPPAPGVPPLVLPSIMGGFFGLNAAGTSFFLGGFSFFGGTPPTPNAPGVGQFNAAVGPGIFSGFFGLTAFGGSASGSGSAGVCFNAFGGVGPCTTGLTATPTPSIPAAGTPGFGGFGAEVGRAVAIAPVPEPGTAALLGLGMLGLAAAARRARR